MADEKITVDINADVSNVKQQLIQRLISFGVSPQKRIRVQASTSASRDTKATVFTANHLQKPGKRLSVGGRFPRLLFYSNAADLSTRLVENKSEIENACQDGRKGSR